MIPSLTMPTSIHLNMVILQIRSILPLERCTQSYVCVSYTFTPLPAVHMLCLEICIPMRSASHCYLKYKQHNTMVSINALQVQLPTFTIIPVTTENSELIY